MLRKMFSWFLIFIMMFSLLPVTPSVAFAAADATAEAEPTPPATGKIELTSKRTENSKIYLKSDGSKELVTAEIPMHYESTINNVRTFEDIDSNITDTGLLSSLLYGDDYKNNKNSFDLRLSKNLSKKSFSLNKDGVSITANIGEFKSKTGATLLTKSTASSKTYTTGTNKLNYANVIPNTDLTFYSVNDGIKEYITLYKQSSLGEFSFDLAVSGGTIAAIGDGSYKIVSARTNTEIFRIPRFLMWDSKGGKDNEQNSYNYNVPTVLSTITGGYRLTVKPDLRWLSAPERVFPIYIDPTITQYVTEDSYVQSGYPTTTSWDQRALYVGTGSTKGIMRTETKFTLPDLSGARILSAAFDVYQYGNCNGVCPTSSVTAYTTASYNPTNVYWNNKPAFLNSWGSASQANPYGWYHQDVSSLVRHWYEGGNSTGSWIGSIGFASTAEGTWGYRTWVSKNNPDYSNSYPKLTVSYNDYNATYYPTDVPSMFAGTTTEVPITVVNTGRNVWLSSQTKVSYHWVNNTTGAVLKSGLQTDIPANVAAKGGITTVLAKVKVPTIAGSYTLQWDMIQPGITWFSDQGVVKGLKTVTVSAPSFSSITHIGSDSIYSKVGPVDAVTGGISYSSTDMSVPSSIGGVSFSRSYDSNQLSNKTFNQDANGYIKTWLFNGPYKEAVVASRLTKAFIPGEATMKPSPGMTGSNNLWAPETETETTQVRLNQVFHRLSNFQVDTATNVSAYAHVYVYSPSDQTVQLRLGSDDGIKAWLNGTVLISREITRTLTLDSDIVSANLRQGWNSLTLKVSQGSASWQMSARFTNTSAQPLSGLIYSTYNPEIWKDQGVLGSGWSASFEERLYISDPENIYYKNGSGNINVYTKNTDGTYKKPAGITVSLTKNLDGTYYLLDKSGNKSYFGTDGKISRKTNLLGNTLSYEYVNGLCSRIINQNRSLAFEYNAASRLIKVNNNANQAVRYEYDANGVLSKVFDGQDNYYEYSYIETSKLERFRDKAGAVTSITYTGDKVNAITDALGNATNITYVDRLTTITDPLGRVTKLGFDSANMLSTMTNAKNYREKYVYDINFNLTKTFPDLATNDIYYYSINYKYDVNRNLLETTYPDGNKTTYVYVGNDMTSSTDMKGQITRYTYSTDGKRLLLSVTDSNAKVTTYGYDAMGRIVSVTDPKLQVSRYTYNSEGDILTAVTPKGEIMTNEYNSIGLIIKNISTLGKISTIEYDGLNRPVKVTDPLGTTIITEYSVGGNVIKTTDPKSNARLMDYDLLGRMIKATDEAGATTQFEYDKVGNKVKMINAKGKIFTYNFDVLNQIISQTDPEGNTINVTYDRNGNIVSTTDEKGNTSTSTYDKMGAVVNSVTPEGGSNNIYDKNHNVTAVTGTTSVNKLLYKNDFNITRQDSLAPISGSWNLTGGTYNQTDSSTAITTYRKSTIRNLNFSNGTVEFRVRRSSTTAPYFRLLYRSSGANNYYIGYIGSLWRAGAVITGQTEQYANGTGTLAVNTWYNIKIVSLGENVKLYVNNVKVIDYTFTRGLKEGQIELATYQTNASFDDLQVSSGSETVSVSYDPVNRPTQIATNTNGIARDAVDAAGNITQSVSATNTVSLTYDVNNQVTGVTNIQNSNGAVLASGQILRDAEGKITQITKANGDITRFGYDNGGRTISTVTTNRNAMVLASFGYEYDANSNVTSIIDKVRQERFNYSYDVRNQLTEDEKYSYSYDIAGNRLTRNGSDGVINYTYDENGDGNKLTQYNYTANDENNSYSATFSYDKSGNVTSRNNSKSGITNYEYDSSNKLKKAILPSGVVIEYIYDSNSGRRIQRIKTDTAGTKSYINFSYDGDMLISESDLNGNLIRAYTWDENENLISISIYNSDGTFKTYQYVKNAKGDVLGLTDTTGAKVVNYEYDSWGNVLKSETISDTVPANLNELNPRLYASYWYDSDLAQYFMKVRMYDPETGRFFSKDPVVASEFALDQNPYLYTANNPITRIDPSGKGFFSWVKNNAAAIVGGVVGTVVGVAVGAVVGLATGGLGTGAGYVAGAFVAGAITGALAGYVAGGVAGGLTQVAIDRASGKKSSIGNSFNNGFSKGSTAGAIGGAISGAISAGITAASVTILAKALVASSTTITAANGLADRTYSVYVEKSAGVINYVGRTVDIVRRAKEWSSDGRIVQEVYSNLTYAQARGVEQILIDNNGGLTNLANKINGISTLNPNYSHYINEGTKALLR